MKKKADQMYWPMCVCVYLVLGRQEQINGLLVQEEAFCHLPHPSCETFEWQRASSLSTRAYTRDIWTRTDAHHHHILILTIFRKYFLWEKEGDCTSTNADWNEQSVLDPSFLRVFHQLEPWLARGLGGVLFWSCENEAANRGAVRAKARMSSVLFILSIVALAVFSAHFVEVCGFFYRFEFARFWKK